LQSSGFLKNKKNFFIGNYFKKILYLPNK